MILKNNSNKHVKNLKKIILICIRYKRIDTDPFDDRKLQNRTYLTADELRRIVEKKLTTLRLEQPLDFFLFSCYKGLSYANAHKLQLTNIGVGVDGKKWIFNTGIYYTYHPTYLESILRIRGPIVATSPAHI